MKPFRSRKEMLIAHEQMFGEAGRTAASLVLRRASKLFLVPLEALNIRVVLAPVELGPYNRHTGYCAGGEGEAAFILGNRHMGRTRQKHISPCRGVSGLRGFHRARVDASPPAPAASGACGRSGVAFEARRNTSRQGLVCGH
jgi:hypothetical protein